MTNLVGLPKYDARGAKRKVPTPDPQTAIPVAKAL